MSGQHCVHLSLSALLFHHVNVTFVCNSTLTDETEWRTASLIVSLSIFRTHAHSYYYAAFPFSPTSRSPSPPSSHMTTVCQCTGTNAPREHDCITPETVTRFWLCNVSSGYFKSSHLKERGVETAAYMNLSIIYCEFRQYIDSLFESLVKYRKEYTYQRL